MRRESHVRFCEGGGVRLPSATRRNVYVRSRRAGERVMKAMVRFITATLSLRVNEAKSAVDEPKKRKFLGYTFHGRSKLRIATKSIERLKARVRELTRRKVSISLEDRLAKLSRYLRGWMSYFRLTEAPSVLRDLDKWIRHRVRVCIWSTWKLPRTRMRKLEALGARRDEAWKSAMSRRGRWFITMLQTVSTALSAKWLREQGLQSLSDRWLQLNSAS